MLVKVSVITEKSFRLYNKVTTCNDNENLDDFLHRIEENGMKVVNFDRIAEVQCGKSFTELSSLDISSLKEMSFMELKNCFSAGI